MTPTVVGLLGLVGLFGLLALRMPVGVAMAVVGTIGFGVLNSWPATMAQLGREPYVIASSYELIVIPLFVLMGNLASISGMSRDLYQAAYSWFGHWRGGLASATIAACAGFAAVSGSSVASAVTMGRVALPEMRHYKYGARLSTGCIAAGGTLGILIPPSTGFVIYAILTEESIGRLFLAGIIPGLLLTALFMVAIYIQCRINPELGPPGPVTPMRKKFTALRKASAMVCIVIITIGGIYIGAFSPTEAAGIGAFLSLILALARRRVTTSAMSDVLLRTVRTTALVFMIIVGAHIFSPFIALTNIPEDLAELLGDQAMPRISALLIILLTYIILGTFLEGFAMLVLTLPIVHPLILALGYDPIWFGIVVVKMCEVCLITPPIGLNCYVVAGVRPDIPLQEVFRGIGPFFIADVITLGVFLAFPEVITWLPDLMIQR